MSVGAVVVKSAIDPTSLEQPRPDVELLLPSKSLAPNSYGSLSLVAWNRSHIKSPPASIRQALLQTFLF
jgi:hypothetical protein